MKKIMSAVLAAGMLAGIATAADVSFAYKGSNYFQADNNNADFVLHKDCLSVGLTTEAAGVVVDYDAYNNSIVADEYYGWMNFALPLGQLQLTGGAWNGRFVNRVLTDKNDLDGAEFELHKPGVINGTAGKDSDNLTFGKLGLVGAWTLADVLPGTLMVKLGLARYYDSEWNKNGGSDDNKKGWLWNPDKDYWSVKAGFLGEVAYRQEGAFSANLAVRSLNKHSYSFGAWVSPELADTVQMTVGGTFATLKVYDKDDRSWTNRKYEYGIDFRLRLQVTDDLSLTTMNNLSSGYKVEEDENQGRLWNMLNATYRMADNLKASFTVQSDAKVFCPVPHGDDRHWDLYMTPSLIIDASERTRVSASMRAYLPDVHKFTIKNIVLTVPVIFSFHY